MIGKKIVEKCRKWRQDCAGRPEIEKILSNYSNNFPLPINGSIYIIQEGFADGMFMWRKIL